MPPLPPIVSYTFSEYSFYRTYTSLVHIQLLNRQKKWRWIVGCSLITAFHKTFMLKSSTRHNIAIITQYTNKSYFQCSKVFKCYQTFFLLFSIILDWTGVSRTFAIRFFIHQQVFRLLIHTCSYEYKNKFIYCICLNANHLQVHFYI